MRNFMKTPKFSDGLLENGFAISVQEDPKCMPRPGDVDWVDPKTIPIEDVEGLVREQIADRIA